MRRVDVVLLTAITLEYQAAKKVDAGAWQGSHWEEETGPHKLPVAFRSFCGKGGRRLRIMLAQAGDPGIEAALNALLPLVKDHQPLCIAMSGVCAGRPGKTNLGDVIAADRLFVHDTGKKLPKKVQQDLKTYNLRADWKVALEHFDFAARFQHEEWWKHRPVPYEWQETWVLAKLNQGVMNPSSLPECNEYCPQWEKVIESLWKSGDVEEGKLTLTESGRRRISSLLIKHRNQVPDTSPSGELIPFKVHVAPMGSGNRVIEDEQTWSFVSQHMRKTLGLDMEASALGDLAYNQRKLNLDVLVMKGVMDFANHGRDDHFKEFAARASAECLIAFLREHLDVEVVPDIDDLLVPGTEKSLPPNPPPSALLNAHYEVVPFHERGRETILKDLDRWCDEGPSIAVRLIHAEGGAGKTRLAIEWIRRRQEHGWAAGFLPKDVPDDWFKRLWEQGQPVVVVLDYAESRSESLRQVLPRMHRYAQQEGTGALRRMRIVLLARNKGDWWQSLRQGYPEMSAWLEATPPHGLTPLATTLAEREEMFDEAAEKFAERRGTKYERRPLQFVLADRSFNRVLYLHMAALATVESLDFEVTTLMEVILDHEEHFWESRVRQSDLTLSLQRSLARQMVAAATLRGGLATFSEATVIATRLLGERVSSEQKELLLLLQRIYQRIGEAPSLFLPPLEPDLLGESLVIRIAAPPKLEVDRVPADWIDRVLPADEKTDIVKAGLLVIGRASAMQPAVLRPWIARLLMEHLHTRGKLALEAALTIGQRTAFSVLADVLAERLETSGDMRLAHELDAVDIPHPTVSLRRVAEWVTRIRLRALPTSTDEKTLSQKAHLLNAWGARLRDLGRHDEALKATSEAVEIRRSLAQRSPKAFRPSLAMSLTNMGAMLSALGRYDEALTVTGEAVAIRRALAQHNPEDFLPDLASSLNNLGTFLRAQGRNEEALENLSEAVEIRRVLAQHGPKSFHADLADSLSNLGNTLRSLGRRHEALKALSEAVDIDRALVRFNSDAFQPGLANSLNNLGNALSSMGHRQEALEALFEAIEIHRTLAHLNPEAFQRDLAASLHNLGAKLSDMGRREEALKVTGEALEIRRALASLTPAALQSELAESLNNMGSILLDQSQFEESLKAAREAVKIRRSLAQDNPKAFQHALADSLDVLGNSLAGLNRSKEAFQMMEEAVEIRRGLVQNNPEAFQPGLASSLNNLGIQLSTLGQHERSLKILDEAVKIRQALAQHNPDAFLPELADSLNNLGTRLSDQGHNDEALKALNEAVEIRRGLMCHNPEAFRHRLASSLTNLSMTLRTLGRSDEALETAGQSVELSRILVQQNPEAFQPYLALSLNNLGLALIDLGRHEEALQVTNEAVNLYRMLMQRTPEAFQSKLAFGLYNRCIILSGLTRYEEALNTLEEAVNHLWPFFERLPQSFRQAIARMFKRLRALYESLGRPLPPEFRERMATFARLTKF